MKRRISDQISPKDTAIPPSLHGNSDPHFWELPKLPEGDVTASELYQAVGIALSAWETFEFVMAELFKILVESESPAASRVYGRITSIQGRKQALEYAAEIFFSRQKLKDQQRTFKFILNNYDRASQIRNNIAHGVVMMAGGQNKEGNFGFYLLAPAYNSNRRFVLAEATDDSGIPKPIPFAKREFDESRYCYTSQQIVMFVVHLAPLIGEVLPFALSLKKAPPE
jgi:hypothetical protein